MSKERKYFNKKQLEAMAIAAKNEYIVASRGFGKSEGIDAPRLVRNVFAMPRSAGALLSPTYGKLLRNTLPAIFHALDRLGYKRNIHYFVGRRAPKYMNYETPYIDPFEYDYTIHWFNGSVQHLISFDRPMSANSMSLDYVFGFEAKFLNFEKIKNEVLPANRGNLKYFEDCPWHHGQLYTTDMPTNKTGMWILDKEKEMDPELIQVIKETYAEIIRLKKEKVNKNRQQYLERRLNKLRSYATFYAEYNVFDNIELLGEDFIATMKRDLPPLVFKAAILNKKLKKIEGGFYSAINENIHFYSSYNNTFLDSLDYDLQRAVESDCRTDGDHDFEKPLCIALDYNAHINWLVAGQHDEKVLRVLKSFFVKGEKRVGDLLKKFHDYYQIRNNRDVIFYYDHTALQGAYAISGDTFADFIISTLQGMDWNVFPVYIGQAYKHDVKHRYINDGLKGIQYLLPLFNQDNNEELCLALPLTGVIINHEGFKKNKSGEKYPDSPDDPVELRTDSTDAFDTLYIGCVFHPISSLDTGSPASRWA